jgi:hypothetical protein
VGPIIWPDRRGAAVPAEVQPGVPSGAEVGHVPLGAHERDDLADLEKGEPEEEDAQSGPEEKQAGAGGHEQAGGEHRGPGPQPLHGHPGGDRRGHGSDGGDADQQADQAGRGAERQGLQRDERRAHAEARGG